MTPFGGVRGRALGLAAVAMVACCAHAQQAVFRIGTFDRSSLEFSGDSPKEPVRYIVGQSGDKSWYASQTVFAPGQQPSAASAPRAIVFSLASAPAKSYVLHLSVLLESACVPALRVEINGRHGLLFLHPKLDFSNGDQGDSFYPAYSQADATLDVPGSDLHAGRNELTLQAVAADASVVPDASLTYDAMELDRADAAPPKPAAEVVPTIFYTRQGVGLTEQVQVFVHSAEPMPKGMAVELALGGKRYRESTAQAEDFGDARLTYQVPEFAAAAQAQVSWEVAGRRSKAEQTVAPQKKWTLYLVPHIHVDVGYSDYQAKVAAIQAHAIDEAIEMIAKHPEFRYSLDGEWDLAQFLATRTPAQQQRALADIEAQKIFVPAQYANLLTGFPTAETLIRSLYPSADFSREHHTPFDYANITDVPSYSWSYASILAAAGIHDLVGGSNNYRAPVLLQGRLNEDSPFYWQGPDGGKVLLWYSRIYQQMQMLFGLPPVLDAGRETLPLFLQQYEHPGYHADAVILYGSQVENTDLFPQQAELAGEWNRQYAYPRMEYSGFHTALEAIAKQFGAAIPTISGDGGPYWEDGIASDAHYAAMERWNEPRALSAEKLDTLSTLADPELAPDTTLLDHMWTNMVLMDEHTWDAYNSVSSPRSEEAVDQLAIKDRYAVNAQAQADFLVRNSLQNLARSIPGAAGTLIVFNTLNWQRDGLVAVDLPDGYAIVDGGTHQTVPYTMLFAGNGFHHVEFLAAGVPAVGHKTYSYALQKTGPVAAAKAGAGAGTDSTIMENAYYRVTLDPASGAIGSIYDKQLQRELVNEKSPYRFGQYLYVTGGDKAPNTLLQYSHVEPAPQLTVHGAQNGTLLSIEPTVYGMAAHMESSDTNTPRIETDVLLFRNEKKIEIVEHLKKKEVYTKEGVYFAFPFDMPQPQFQYEVQNGVVDPATEMYPGAGHEWFSVQHWASVQQNGVSATVMPLDASLVTLGDINRGQWLSRFGRRPGTIFSYVMNNYWDTNYRAGQGGEFSFHYVITSAPTTDAPALSRMGWEAVTPFETDTVTTQDRSGPMGTTAAQLPTSLLDVNDPDLLFETWKHAEDGNGTILRFLDLGGAARSVTVRLPALDLKEAWQTDAVERDQQRLQLEGHDGFEFAVRPHQIVTVRVVTKKESLRAASGHGT
jgi:alpha-mannosidase